MLSQYDLSTEKGRENFKYFLDHVKVKVFNLKTKSLDECLADDLMTGKYEASLRQKGSQSQSEREYKEADKADAVEKLEKLERITPFTTLIDALIRFNAVEHSRLSGQSPVTGKDDHAAKVAAFAENLKELRNFATKVAMVSEPDLKAQIKLFLTKTKSACDMRTHKNMDAMTGYVAGFFKKTPGLTSSQKNYATFVTENKPLIDKLDVGVKSTFKF